MAHTSTADILRDAVALPGDPAWKRYIADLAPGDTVDTGTSTKWRWIGPGRVEYLIHASGWNEYADQSVTRDYSGYVR